MFSPIQIRATAQASKNNPRTKTLDFILTDDAPNANGVGIKQEDFLGFADSAIYMPIKMASGKIAPNHTGSTPIGVITATTILENKVLGAGIVWPEERPADIEYLTEMAGKGEAFLSWELQYDELEVDAAGTGWLRNPVLLATTLVSQPAYQERTPVIAVASVEGEVMDEEVTTVEAPVIEVPAAETPEVEDPVKLELEELRAFKQRVEQEALKAQQVAKVKVLFGELSQEQIAVLADLTDAQLDTVKSLVASKKSVASVKSLEIPELSAPAPKAPIDILRAHLFNTASGGH